MSQFAFLQLEWPDIYDAAAKAESLAYPDPRAACLGARQPHKFPIWEIILLTTS
jgi:type I restriction enzyme, R subunit